jgi:hypothetical protein
MTAVIKPHEPGIYYFMSNEEYHADPALGSTDLRTFKKNPARFWRGSWMNPNADLYRKPETESTIVGTGIHCYLLDGAAKFTDRYMRRPDDPPGATSGEKGANTKAFNKSLLPHQIGLHGNDWRIIMDAGRTITQHPDLSEVFEGGDHEVSVFWINEMGIRCKCRFDIMKPRGIGDLKSIANQYGDRLDIACQWAIKRFRYDIQAAYYMEGRRQVPKLFKQNKAFVCLGSDADGPITKELTEAPGALALILDRLQEVAKCREFAFQFIFISKESPEAWACTLSRGNPIIQHAERQISEIFEAFGRCMEIYGTNPWPETWRLSELTPEEMPGGEWGWN